MYTKLEGFFSNASFVLLFLTMLSYWTYTAFKDLKINIPFLSFSLSTIKLDKSILSSYKSITNESWLAGSFFMFLSNFSLMSLLILRWINSGHFPLSNLYESLMFLSWSCTCIHFILFFSLVTVNNTIDFFPAKSSFISEELGSENSKFDKPTNNVLSLLYKNDASVAVLKNESLSYTTTTKTSNNLEESFIGCLTAPCALLMNTYATFSLPPEMQQITPLVPALQSNWLMMHVTVMIISYAALILGSLLSIAFLILTFDLPMIEKLPFKKTTVLSKQSSISADPVNISDIRKKRYKKNPSGISLTSAITSFNSPFFDSMGLCPKVFLPEKSTTLSKQSLDRRVKIAENLDNYSYRILGIGFPFLTIGILSGAVWANEAWGSYWSWDPKETWALLTWFVYAIYLHTRFTKGWQGKKPAIIASLGFIFVWICFLGVNLIGEGLHSYGWFSSK
uniref:Cytochrome c biogenesis protein CcsA n=1 Tax=Lobochlamys culleus TaxID=51693 RepID=A0A0S2IDE3_9CHLO|nr:heme attachment to plastid cytochrome c [Lobochlamys culleus]